MAKASKPKRMKLAYINPQDLKDAPWNPAARTEKKQLGGLVSSLRKYGLQQPISVDYNGTIQDGHRRKHAAIMVGLTEVPVIMTNGVVPNTTKFKEINKTRQPITGLQSLEIYLKGYQEAISEGVLQQIEIIRKATGTSFLKKCFEQMLNPLSLTSLLATVLRHTKIKTPEFKKAVCYWALKYPQCIYDIKRGYKEMAVKDLHDIIVKMKPVKRALVVAD